ncbi:hypothetical protein D3C87_1797430 [compost metagenome]
MLLFVAALAIAGCNTVKPAGDTNLLVLGGKVEALGMSTFQYGTHLLNTGDKTYALKSDKLNLKSYEGKEVVLKGVKVTGYPVDGGPEFIDVQEISNK